MSTPSARTFPERASGLLSAALAVAILMGLLGLMVNVAIGLWTRSTIDAVAYDAAREVATQPAGIPLQPAGDRAIARARAVLGPVGDEVSLRFDGLDDGPMVTLHVRAPGVSLLPSLVAGGPTVGSIDRRIVMIREGR